MLKLYVKTSFCHPRIRRLAVLYVSYCSTAVDCTMVVPLSITIIDPILMTHLCPSLAT